MSGSTGRGLPPGEARAAAERGLGEDLARGDVTSLSVLPPGHRSRARLVARQDLIISGLDVAMAVFELVDPSLAMTPRFAEGQRAAAGDVLLELEGASASILAAERTALNYLQRLCGIATLARRAVDSVAGSGVDLLATRKTTPGMRLLERRAAESGGFAAHRVDLGDGILIKDNHAVCAGGAAAAVKAARRRAPRHLKVQVEIDRLEDLLPVLDAGADMVLLDNFTPEQVAAAVAKAAGRAVLEASGGIGLDALAAYAATGVDRISVGFVTHSAPAADLALDMSAKETDHGA